MVGTPECNLDVAVNKTRPSWTHCCVFYSNRHERDSKLIKLKIYQLLINTMKKNKYR